MQIWSVVPDEHLNSLHQTETSATAGEYDLNTEIRFTDAAGPSRHLGLRNTSPDTWKPRLGQMVSIWRKSGFLMIVASMYTGGVTSQDRRQILGVCRGEEFLTRNSLEKRSEKRPFAVAELTLMLVQTWRSPVGTKGASIYWPSKPPEWTENY